MAKRRYRIVRLLAEVDGDDVLLLKRNGECITRIHASECVPYSGVDTARRLIVKARRRRLWKRWAKEQIKSAQSWRMYKGLRDDWDVRLDSLCCSWRRRGIDLRRPRARKQCTKVMHNTWEHALSRMVDNGYQRLQRARPDEWDRWATSVVHNSNARYKAMQTQ